jgi:hypothetical protein
MNLKNRMQVTLEKFEKCELICDSDASLGSLYDFACALKSFLIGKIHAEQTASAPPSNPDPDIKPE